MKRKKLGEHGDIQRDGDVFVNRAFGSQWMVELVEQNQMPGVEPEGEPGVGKVYRKTFRDKRIYLPHEYDRAYAEILAGEDVVPIGMNGYSNVGDLPWHEWGIEQGGAHYLDAARGVFDEIVDVVERDFDRVDIGVAHGASDVGIDLMLQQACADYKLNNLGHSCPEYMMYVVDDDGAVYVGTDKTQYADMFINSCKILISANGKEQSFRHDYKATFEGIKRTRPDGSTYVHRPRLILCNVLRAISKNGGGPPGVDKDGKVIDATAAFEELFFAQANARLAGSNRGAWDDLVDHVTGSVKFITRGLVTPSRAYRKRRFIGSAVA